MTDDYLLIGGSRCPVNRRVIHDPALAIRPWRGARPRRRLIKKITLHWTGGEGSAEQVHRVLQSRRLGLGLGVEIIIDRLGDIYQCCDPAHVDAMDDGQLDSVGIEVANYGFRRPNVGRRWPGKRTPRKGLHRAIYCRRFLGRERHYADFLAAQKLAVFAALDTLTAALDIPRDVPREEDGSVAHRRLTRAERHSFAGVVGHYHLSARKQDPGPRLIDEVVAHFATHHPSASAIR